ncbi:signal peptidase I [Pseudoflavonifractor sp. MSJ-37]|uniref:signal peptidase I n=1 Tax=Pseudoflavonifractor sp. MSJ-37 TaxID=2841531 RepID=UPI001C102BEB|nr:signal peptidase I [Pseudoflavonifractor sp. MSJ-37]MBU5435900.1 signal peptidase I [Pseudoflavonifractor sp. MSJ-37]
MGEGKRTAAQALKLDLYTWLQALTAALLLLVALFTFVGRVVGVEGISMEPTLRDGDTILLRSLGYTPAQGDVVVLTKPFGTVSGPIVKRVVAVAGQRVQIDYDSGTVSVDGAVLEEPYLDSPMRWPAGTTETLTDLTVPEGSVFVMGDNREHSADSRDERLGPVDVRYILGKAEWILLPAGHFGPIG